MAPRRPGTIVLAAFLAAGLAVFAARAANAQAATGLNLSGLPFSPSLFQQPAPQPLLPQPGGAITSQTVTMPVPPLARTTLPNVDAQDAQASDTGAAQPQEDGPSHAALDDRTLENVR